MASTAGNIRVEPVNVKLIEFEQSLIKAIADVSDSLDGTFFTFASGASEVATHYAWLDGVAAADPAPAGLIAITVAYSTDDSAATIAGLMATAIDGVGAFEATSSGDEFVVTSILEGKTFPATDSDTGFGFQRCAEGKDFDLGLLDGDVETSYEEALLDVNAHQTGTTLVTQLRQGVSAEISLTLKETDLGNLESIFADGAGGTDDSQNTKVFGWGNIKQGTNVIVQSGKLILHPVALEASDLTRDLTFWKAYPVPESLTYSGENPNVVAVTFKTFIDENIPNGINLFVFGDSAQYFPS